MSEAKIQNDIMTALKIYRKDLWDDIKKDPNFKKLEKGY